MIGYLMVGTNNYDKALEYYDALFATIGGKRAMDFGNSTAYGFAKGPMFCVTKPYDGNKATIGNGSMVAINLASPEQVNAFHATALELGGSDEGAAGPRGDGGFYAGYFRDLDGNKLCAFTMA
ncbi:MAG: VOC family protein [Alphaproteobacteria bacterium]|nr:VOC family protein [Alphaproteobacteria bacterium]